MEGAVELRVHPFRSLAPPFHNEGMSSDSFITDLYP
jgi:hypothetical protein